MLIKDIMPLTDLPANLQIIELYNFEMFSRAFWIFLMISVSLIYVFILKDREKETPFFSLATVRGILYCFSIIILISSPLLFFSMSPEWDVWGFIFPFFNLYIITLVIYIITLNIDLIQYGIPVLLRMGGLKTDDPNVERIYNKYFNKNKNGKRI